MRRWFATFLAGSIVFLAAGSARADDTFSDCAPESGGELSRVFSAVDEAIDVARAADEASSSDPSDDTSSSERVERTEDDRGPPPMDDPATDEEIIERGRTLEVPWRKQSGPKCGFYALGMVLDFWNGQDTANLAPPVEGEEAGMFPWAVREGLTTEGGLWEDDLANVARNYGYEVWDTNTYGRNGKPTLQTLRDAVEAGTPPLVAFDVDHSGNPRREGGDRGHWAVIEGFYTDPADGTEYAIAKHGWRGESYVWKVADLEASWDLHRRATAIVKPAG